MMRLPRRRSPLERLGAVQRFAERTDELDLPLREQLDRFSERIADLSRRLDDVELRLRGD